MPALFPLPPPSRYTAARRTVTLQCLTEVGSLTMGPEFSGHFLQFYRVFMGQLAAVLPPGTNVAKAYEGGSDEQQAFVQNLALFFTGFFRVSRRCVYR